MLVEVLRKLWVGIIITKITAMWEKYNLLAPRDTGGSWNPSIDIYTGAPL